MKFSQFSPGIETNETTRFPKNGVVAATSTLADWEPGSVVKVRGHPSHGQGDEFRSAGEHASSLFGWMQGALESGNRAAQEINDRVG
jgi:monoamine oxidase